MSTSNNNDFHNDIRIGVIPEGIMTNLEDLMFNGKPFIDFTPEEKSNLHTLSVHFQERLAA